MYLNVTLNLDPAGNALQGNFENYGEGDPDCWS